MDYATVLGEKLETADRGRLFWNQLVKRLPIEAHDVAIALFQRDRECAGIVLDYGKYLADLKQYEKIYILTDDPELYEKARSEHWVATARKCSTEQLDQLVLLYQLYKFSRQLIFGTLHNIEDADGTFLKGVKDISLEEIVVTAVLDLPFDKCVCATSNTNLLH